MFFVIKHGTCYAYMRLGIRTFRIYLDSYIQLGCKVSGPWPKNTEVTPLH